MYKMETVKTRQIEQILQQTTTNKHAQLKTPMSVEE